jgi:hypothetical protein
MPGNGEGIGILHGTRLSMNASVQALDSSLRAIAD